MPRDRHEWMALLGRQDIPTDGVEDYCTCLGEALELRGFALKRVRVPWAEKGWIGALRQLSGEAAPWRGQWVLLQYTALAWSRRGFCFGALVVLKLLRRKGARVAVVFHDTTPFGGTRLRDRLRSWIQGWVMRHLALRSNLAVSALPGERMSWAQPASVRRKFVTIPIGSNVHYGEHLPASTQPAQPTVVVFGVTEGNAEEAARIGKIVGAAARRTAPLKLMVVGRGANQAADTIRKSLDDAPVSFEVRGVLSSDEIRSELLHSSVQLFIRSGLSARRGSLVAGIVSGLPILGWETSETAFPMTAAGILTAPGGDEGGLIRALSAVLTDSSLATQLSARSLRAAQDHFSWHVIAARFVDALTGARDRSGGDFDSSS
jgi:glycosyltransferase involved in cell wall biosynthesis